MLTAWVVSLVVAVLVYFRVRVLVGGSLFKSYNNYDWGALALAIILPPIFLIYVVAMVYYYVKDGWTDD